MKTKISRQPFALYVLQAQLRELQGRMLRFERLAALGQLSAGIAHELMNPVSYVTQNVATLRRELNVIRNYLIPRLAREPNREVAQALEELPSLLQDLDSGTHHIRELAVGIRSQARGEETGQVSELRTVVDFATRIARAELRQQGRLRAAGPAVQVGIGPVKLLQVLLNLLVNSAHALLEVDRPGFIDVRWAQDGAMVRLEVSDNGCGIDPSLQQKVFEPLFTTKPAGMGTGLGLGIIREIVQEAGGAVSLQSTPGEGTTLRVTLPLADQVG